MINVGINSINDIKIGIAQVYRAYVGTLLVWEYNSLSTQYLTFEALDDGTFSFSNDIDYSIDNGQTWTTLTANTQSPTITIGNTILWKGTFTSASSTNGIGTFSSTGQFNAYGNIMSLLWGDNFVGKDVIMIDYCFTSLLEGSKVVDANNLILPATTLSIGCYRNMFMDCTLLTTAPELPSTVLTTSCYSRMFKNCTSLITPPELPATTLSPQCYFEMFGGCGALTSSPALPATTLSTQCYYQMFMGCTSLTTAPELPATTLTNSCYRYMFMDCTLLTTAPELPATTLTNYCYNSMFYNCTSLNYIKCLATNVSATNCLTNWVNNVSSTGTFVKDPNMTSWTTGVNGIPTGWTIITQ